jgi:murein L,D-transpeptidase YcbB/YkuD
LELAEILLRDKGWDRARIDANTETETVFLTDPLPVLVMYWTAEVTPDGTVRFFDDIYERDAGVLKGLNAPFTLDRPQA